MTVKQIFPGRQSLKNMLSGMKNCKKSQQLSAAEIDRFLQREIGLKFEQVLLHAGVFKRTEEGQNAFDAFVKAAGGI